MNTLEELGEEKQGKKEMLAKIDALGEELDQLRIEMNKAAKAVTTHFENRPPDLPGRKYQRALKRWCEQLNKKESRYRRIRDEGLQKSEQPKIWSKNKK